MKKLKYIVAFIEGDNLTVYADSACGMGESMIFIVRVNGVDSVLATILVDNNKPMQALPFEILLMYITSSGKDRRNQPKHQIGVED